MARVVCVAPDLFFASKLQSTLESAGHDVTVRPSAPPDLGGVDVVIVDLTEVEPEGLGGRGVPALGFYRHTEPETRERAERAGFDLVVPRSRMAREMNELVAGLVG